MDIGSGTRVGELGSRQVLSVSNFCCSWILDLELCVGELGGSLGT